MQDPQDDFDSVTWNPGEDSPPTTQSKSNGKQRSVASQDEQLNSPIADETDLAGIGKGGYIHCTVGRPQKEHDGTKDAYVSYLVTTRSDFKTFARNEFNVRRRFTDFLFLYKTLYRQYPHVAVPPLPDKHKMEYVRGDRFGPDFTQRRAHSLHRFMRRICLHPVLRRNVVFLEFLETSDWNASMRARARSGSLSDPAGSPLAGGSGGMGGSGGGAGGVVNAGTSALDTLSDWSINLFSKVHKTDKRFTSVWERSNKLDEDLSVVEKTVARVGRREGDLADDYTDLATQLRKLLAMEPGVGPEMTAFAAGVEETGQGLRTLKEQLERDYLTSLKDMQAYVGSAKGLLRTREQKQLDFEALTQYLGKSSSERDGLASQHGNAVGLSLTNPSGFIRSKIEDVRGVDHEQSRRERIRKLEMQIERLTDEVEMAKLTSEAFDAQTVLEMEEFERVKACEFGETLGAFADANIAFFGSVIETWEGYISSLEQGKHSEKVTA